MSNPSSESVASGTPPESAAPMSPYLPALDEVHRRYRLRFARGPEDLDLVLRLRFSVFNIEMGEGLASAFRSGRDEDSFDAQCQHLMVVHIDSGETIGTYRLQVPEMALAGAGFYSATEFDLSALPPDLITASVELGRACIREDHRNRETLFLLWRGLAAYMLWNKKICFFGCSSLTTHDPAVGVRAYRELGARGHVHPTLRVPPMPGFECAGEDDLSAPEVHIPSLFRTYLRYGAKVLGPPAIDRAFGTVDFLTLLDVSEMDPKTFANFAQ